MTVSGLIFISKDIHNTKEVNYLMGNDKINSGVVSDIATTLAGISKAFGNLAKAGIELGKASESDGIYQQPFKLDDGTKFVAKWKWQDEKQGLMKIMVKDASGNEVKRQKVKIKNVKNHRPEVAAQVEDMLAEGWDIVNPKYDYENDDNEVTDVIDVENTGNEIVRTSRKLNVTLQRVCSAEEDSIHLVRVYGNYAEKEMQSNLETLLDNAEMLAQITEEPTSFEVTDNGDELDVNPVEMSETECISASLNNILSCAFQTLHNLQAIHWNAKGDRFEDIHMSTESYIWNIRNQIDTLAELCVELTGSVLHPAVLCSSDASFNTQCGFEDQEALNMIHSDMSLYIYCLEFYLPNFTSDVQNIMNIWIRDMKHLTDYTLSRKTNTSGIPSPTLV